MKKIITTSLLFLLSLNSSSAFFNEKNFETEISNETINEISKSYQSIYNIPKQEIKIPTPVEFQLNTQEGSIIILDQNQIQQAHKQVKSIKTDQFEISSNNKNRNLNYLADGNFFTYTNLPYENNQNTILTFESKEKHRYESLILSYKENSQYIKKITLKALINNRYQTILNEKEINSNIIKFPELNTNKFELTIFQSQPHSLKEIQFLRVNQNDTTAQKYQFLASPENSYTIYADSDKKIPFRNLEYGNIKDQAINLNDLKREDNPNYIPSDNDDDTVINTEDNCINIKNPEQTDINENNIGDACEDFDGDKILNYKDNCPNNANFNQADLDNDNIGDICDQIDDRLLEQYPYIQWIILSITAITIIYLSIKQHKN